MRTQGAWTDPPRQQQASVGRWTLRVCALYWGCLGHMCSVSLFTVSRTGGSTAIYDQWLRSKKRESGEPKCSAKGRKTQIGAAMHDFLWHGFFIRGSVPPNPSGSRARDPSGHSATAPARSRNVGLYSKNAFKNGPENEKVGLYYKTAKRHKRGR